MDESIGAFCRQVIRYFASRLSFWIQAANIALMIFLSPSIPLLASRRNRLEFTLALMLALLVRAMFLAWREERRARQVIA